MDPLLSLYHVEHRLARINLPILPRLLKALIYVVFNCVIPPQCSIGKGTRFWHSGLGVVLHPNTIIGENCNIYNHVVVGGGHDGPNGPPIQITIGDNVNIGAGAKILCKDDLLTVGDNSSVGANSVVIENVPPGSVVMGNPARIVGKRHAK